MEIINDTELIARIPLSSEMSFEKYRVLVWKNWTIQKRHYITGTIEVILPVVIVIIFSWIKSTFVYDESSLYTYENEFRPIRSCYGIDDYVSKIYYSPNGAWIDGLMSSAFNDSLLELESFDNANALDEYLSAAQPRNVYGIQFDDSLKVWAMNL